MENTESFWFSLKPSNTNCQISLEHQPKNQSLAPIKSVTQHPVKSYCNEALLLAPVAGDHNCISFYVLIIPYCSLQASQHGAIFLLGFGSQTRSAGWKMLRFHNVLSHRLTELFWRTVYIDPGLIIAEIFPVHSSTLRCLLSCLFSICIFCPYFS